MLLKKLYRDSYIFIIVPREKVLNLLFYRERYNIFLYFGSKATYY